MTGIETDVGGHQVAGGVVLDLRPVGRDRGDAPVEDGGDAHPTLAVDGQRVEELVARQAVQDTRLQRIGGSQYARRGDRPLEHAAGVGLGPVQGVGVRRQADAVGRIGRVHGLGDPRAVGTRVVDPAEICSAAAGVTDAVIGEPEPAVAVHHQVVRAAQGVSVALGVQVGDRAVMAVDPLDTTAEVSIAVESARNREAGEFGPREAAAVVAQVDRAVGTDRGPVGTAGDLGDRLLGAVGMDLGQAGSEHLDQHDRPVGHPDRPFGKLEAARDLGQLGSEFGDVRLLHGVMLPGPHVPPPSRPLLVNSSTPWR
jgi:hypothetical protein